MFAAALARLVDQTGASGAAVVSLDGLVIDAVDASGRSVAPPDAERDYASVFKQVVGAGPAMELGDIRELTIAGAERVTLVRMLSREYFVLLHVPPSLPAGKGRYLLRVAAPDLARDL